MKRHIFTDRFGYLHLGNHISLHLLLPLLGCSAYLGRYLPYFVISWSLALLHELAHILTGYRLGISFDGVILQPFGLCARLKSPVIKSPPREILMLSAGPLTSFLLAFLCGILGEYFPSSYLSYAATASLSMGILNLFPCLPLDGGRILTALFTLADGALSAHRKATRLSRIFALLLLLGGTLLLLTSPFQFSYLLIGVFLLGNLCYEQKSVSQQTLRELLYYKEKLEADQWNRTSFLTAYAHLPARKILRKLSYHQYYTVQVVDRDHHILAYLTESQITEALLHHGIRVTLDDIINNHPETWPSNPPPNRQNSRLRPSPIPPPRRTHNPRQEKQSATP